MPIPPRGPQFGNCKYARWSFYPLGGTPCLDGSPAGFYHTPAYGAVFKRSWIVYFEGGGWCVSAEDCALRATTTRGSSSRWAGNGTNFGHLLNKCCFVTPFCRFHRVMLKSCDGHSFAGGAVIASPSSSSSPASAATPRLASSSSFAAPPPQLHSSGRAIVRATVQALLARFGLRDAADVLVAGCSAGGLAALLHAEGIRAAMLEGGARPRRFKVASLAGVFFSPSGGGAAGADPSSMPFVRQIARAVSERGGGLRCARSLHTRAPPLAVAQTRHCPCSLALPVFPLNLCMCVCV